MRGTWVSCARPKVPVWTNGKWEMSRKLSVIRVAEACQRSTSTLSRRYRGSASYAISGIPAAGSPGQSQTRP